MKPSKVGPQRGKPFQWHSPHTKGFLPPKSLAACGNVYRQAADALFQAIKGTPGTIEAYPLVFLYRHSIEVYIKSILIEFGSDCGIKKDEVRDRKHDLCKQLPDLLRVSLLIGTGLTRLTESAINQLNGTDPGADGFRYQEKFPNKDFDLDHFVFEMEWILDELDSLREGLSTKFYNDVLKKEGIARS